MRELREKVALFCLRLAILLLIAGALILLPEAPTLDFLRYKNAVVAMVTVVLLGKLLYDTFFFDHYNL